MAHTNGPWTGRFEAVNAPDGSLIATVHFIALDGGSIPTEEGHANARLIAAAPEMLEALKFALPALQDALEHAEDFNHLQSASAYKARIHAIEAAIAKAGDRDSKEGAA